MSMSGTGYGATASLPAGVDGRGVTSAFAWEEGGSEAPGLPTVLLDARRHQ